MAVTACLKKRTVAAFRLTVILDDDEQPLPKQRNQKRPTRQWIQRREERSVYIYHQLVQELVLEDPEAYRNFFRLSKEQFLYVVNLFRRLIQFPEPKKAKSLAHHLPPPFCLFSHFE